MGNGRFGPGAGRTVAAAVNPAGIAAGDFNRDGNPDLAVTAASGSITILAGNGFGGFCPLATLTGFANSAAIAAADVNGDGIPDLVNARSGGVDILLGNGAGGFAAASGSPLAAANARAVAVRDVNADGKADVAAARSNAAAVFLGTGTGTFTSSASINIADSPVAIVAADLDGDGNVDLAVSRSGNRALSALLGDGAGAFTAAPATFTQSGGGALVWGDFNKDGFTDLASPDTIRTIRVLLGGRMNTSTTLTTAPFPATTPGQSVTMSGTPAPAQNVRALRNPTGQVEFRDAGVAISTGTIENGTARVTVAGLATGTHAALTAAYLGDTRFNGSASAAVALSVGVKAAAIVQGSGQSAAAGTGFGVPLQMLVTGADDLPMAGVPVTFTAPVGGASAFVTGSPALTNAAGIAEAAAVANTVAGTYSVNGFVQGTPAGAAFTLTNTAGPAFTISANSGGGQTAPIGAQFPLPLQALVRDNNGNPVSGATVAFTAPAAGASAALSAATAVTNASGLASVTATANTTGGSYNVVATAAGVAPAAQFGLINIAPGGGLAPPVIQSPAAGAILTTSILSFQWTIVATAASYEFRVVDTATGDLVLLVSPLGNQSNAVYTFKSGSYRLEMKSCGAGGCGAVSQAAFTVQLGAVPAAAPEVTSVVVANDNGQNRLNCTWNPVTGTDFYFINVIQPNSGPGGGALTVAGNQIGGTTASLLIPTGDASVIVRACNGDGCGPPGPAVALSAAFNSPPVPILAEPFGGSLVDAGANAPVVVFTWPRIQGDNGTNVRYRLFVQDFARNRAALDVFTTNNFYAAYFNPANRYDALLIATAAGGNPVQGPPQAFLVRGRVPDAPVFVEPATFSAIARGPQGVVRVGWTAVPRPDGSINGRLYQYEIRGPQVFRAATTATFVDLLLPPGVYSGIVRVCAAAACDAASEAGWGPWSSNGEGGSTSFTVQ